MAFQVKKIFQILEKAFQDKQHLWKKILVLVSFKQGMKITCSALILFIPLLWFFLAPPEDRREEIQRLLSELKTLETKKDLSSQMLQKDLLAQLKTSLFHLSREKSLLAQRKALENFLNHSKPGPYAWKDVQSTFEIEKKVTIPLGAMVTFFCLMVPFFWLCQDLFLKRNRPY